MRALHSDSRSRRAVLALIGTAAGSVGAAVPAAGTPDSNATATATGTASRPAGAGPATTAAPTDASAGTGTGTTTGTGTQGPVGPAGSHATFGVDAARTGFDPGGRAPPGPVRSAWCVPADGADRLTALAVADGVVVVGTPSDGLRALDAATGERLWRTRFESYPGAPTVVGDRVYATDRRAVHALGVASGRVLWSVAPGNPVTSSVLVAGGGGSDGAGGGAARAFVATGRETEDGRDAGSVVHALDPAGGATRWSTRVDGGTIYGALAAREGVVYAGTAGRSVHAFDAADGTVRWSVAVGEHPLSPAVGRDSVFVGDEAGTVHARNRWTGAERWSHGVGAEVRASPAVADGTVYVAATDGDLHALDAGSGSRRWRFDAGRRVVVAPTVVGDGDRDGEGRTVLVGSGSGNVFAVDAATGEARWSHQLPDDVETPPVAVDGWLYAGDGEGRLHALVDESARVPDAARSCAAPSTGGDSRAGASDADADADGDGVPDDEDYAPRDASVQRRADVRAVASDADDDAGFLRGVGLGAVASLVGVGAGWWLGRRSGERGSDGDDGGSDGEGSDGDDGGSDGEGDGRSADDARGEPREPGRSGWSDDGDEEDGGDDGGAVDHHAGRRRGPWTD